MAPPETNIPATFLSKKTLLNNNHPTRNVNRLNNRRNTREVRSNLGKARIINILPTQRKRLFTTVLKFKSLNPTTTAANASQKYKS
jgi:hypothetical protein